MGKTAQDGIFTPVVVVVRNQLGIKEFNQLRGKGISLHSQGRFLRENITAKSITPEPLGLQKYLLVRKSEEYQY